MDAHSLPSHRPLTAAQPAGASRREFLAYALAASGALMSVGSLLTISAPDSNSTVIIQRLVGACG